MNDHSAPVFWDKYIAIARLYKVRDNALRWYVRHAERYIANFEGLPLGEHEPKQVEAYLRGKGRNPDIESWQYRQIVQAIEILFSKFLSPWAERFPWRDWDASAQTIPADHATLSRSYRPLEADAASTDGDENSSLSRQVLLIFPGMVNALITQIRVRQYSIRTEQAYLGWLYRFTGFNGMEDPSELTDAHISVFIE
jgi:hypothetical protein